MNDVKICICTLQANYNAKEYVYCYDSGTFKHHNKNSAIYQLNLKYVKYIEGIV